MGSGGSDCLVRLGSARKEVRGLAAEAARVGVQRNRLEVLGESRLKKGSRTRVVGCGWGGFAAAAVAGADVVRKAAEEGAQRRVDLTGIAVAVAVVVVVAVKADMSACCRLATRTRRSRAPVGYRDSACGCSEAGCC